MYSAVERKTTKIGSVCSSSSSSSSSSNALSGMRKSKHCSCRPTCCKFHSSAELQTKWSNSVSAIDSMPVTCSDARTDYITAMDLANHQFG